MDDFAGWLRAARAEKGLTQLHVAVLVGAQMADVSRWETGRSLPAADRMCRVVETLTQLDVDNISWLTAPVAQHHTDGVPVEYVRELAAMSEKELSAYCSAVLDREVTGG